MDTIYTTNLTQGKTLAKQVSAYLLTLDGMLNADPVMVTIGKHAYFGAFWQQTRLPLSGAINQEPYIHQMYYLVGAIPDCYRRVNWQTEKHADQFFSVGIPVTEETVNDSRYKEFWPFGVATLCGLYKESMFSTRYPYGVYPIKPIQIVDLV